MPDQDDPTAPPEQPEPQEPATEDWREGIRESAGLWADRPPDAVSPPAIDPTRWEDFPTFRESFLRWFTEPTANAALRSFGMLLHDLILEANRVQPAEPEGIYRHDLRAALADLRAVQGFLAFIGGELEDLDEDDPEDADSYQLCELAERLARRVARIAVEVEKVLA
jgi:hypothetical protein